MSAFTFTKLTPTDLPMIMEWLERLHIAVWFGDPNEWREEIEGNWISDWIWAFRVDHQDRAFGFAQCCWCDRAPEGEWSQMPPKTLGLDYFIANKEDTGKGLGYGMIESFIELVVREREPDYLMADPVPQNRASVKTLEKLGFRMDESTGLMVRCLNRPPA